MEQWRDRINQWFDRHEVPWEVFMSLLAVVFVVLSYVHHPAAVAVDVLLSFGFVTEFVIRLAAARSRRVYLLYHWMDVIALIPAIPGYRNEPWARTFRLLRLLMVLRLLGALDRVTHHVTGVTAQPGLTYLVVMLAVLVLSAAGVNYLVEGKYASEATRNPGLDSYSKAVYSALLNVATEAGTPSNTPVGRGMVIVLMFGGLMLWSLLTASTITYLNELIKARGHRHNPAVEDVKGKLEQLDTLSQDELLSLRGSILAIIDHRLLQPFQSPGRPNNS